MKFYKAYKAAYDTPPENAFAALGYDTVGLVADAITRAGSADPAKIRDALAATQGYKGITGSISYARGQPGPQKTVVDHRGQGRQALPGRRSDAELGPKALTGWGGRVGRPPRFANGIRESSRTEE